MTSVRKLMTSETFMVFFKRGERLVRRFGRSTARRFEPFVNFRSSRQTIQKPRSLTQGNHTSIVFSSVCFVSMFAVLSVQPKGILTHEKKVNKKEQLSTKRVGNMFGSIRGDLIYRHHEFRQMVCYIPTGNMLHSHELRRCDEEHAYNHQERLVERRDWWFAIRRMERDNKVSNFEDHKHTRPDTIRFEECPR